MKYLILYTIQLYWFLKSKKSKPKCIFKKTCSHYVHDITKKHGFLKGIKAFIFRYRNCRSGFEIFKNPITSEKQMLLLNGEIIPNHQIAERLIKTK